VVDKSVVESVSDAIRRRQSLHHALAMQPVTAATVENLRVRGIGFRSLTEALDTTTAQGRFVFHMCDALAEFERSLIRERTQAGLAAARRAGRRGGRPPKLTEDDLEAARALLANPDIGVTQIAHRLGVSPATLYRYIPAARTANHLPDG
jgi:DNA invertase Pin-like site-specific DNA recombinase